jgi:predicted nuclease of predicted toxin-antitoxin system
VGYSVFSIRESCPGIPDLDVLELSRKEEAILLTEDADFGELIFSHGFRAIGIMYVRYGWQELPAMIESIISVLANNHELIGAFCVLTPTKIRVRTLPIQE